MYYLSLKLMQIPCEYSPSKVCADLSDKWDDQDSPVQRSIRTLSELVGVPVNIDLEATKLWNQLQKYYPDGDTFVATITSIVRSWTEALTSRLENNDNSSWMEDFLSKVGGAVKARVETISSCQVQTYWENGTSAFVIAIPLASPPYFAASSYFESDLSKIFNKDSRSTDGVDDKDWANMNLPFRGKENAQIQSMALPSLDMLPRPEILFASHTPYQILIKTIHSGIVVYGSHQPSLELLASYLGKNTKTMKNDTRKPNRPSQFESSEVISATPPIAIHAV
ncbi:MAG: hypothetical protein Q9190_001890 [Brigantiaea leucoxantha]